MTLWKCFKLVTERPDEMRKLKEDFLSRYTIKFHDFFYDISNEMSIFRKFDF